MNTRDAKEILLLYRGTTDDSDPQFRAALDYAKSDPELGQWLREQTKCYDPDEASRNRTAAWAIGENCAQSADPVSANLVARSAARCSHRHIGQCHRAADEMVGAPQPFCRWRAGNSGDWRSARYDLLHRLQLEWSRSRRVRESVH